MDDIEAPEGNFSRSSLLLLGGGALFGVPIAYGMANFLGLSSLWGVLGALAALAVALTSLLNAAVLKLGMFHKPLFVLALLAFIGSGVVAGLSPVAHTPQVGTYSAQVLDTKPGAGGTTNLSVRYPDGSESTVALAAGTPAPTSTTPAYRRDDLLKGDARKIWTLEKPGAGLMTDVWVEGKKASFILDQARFLLTGTKALNADIPAPAVPAWVHALGAASILLWLAGLLQNLFATKRYRVRIAKVREEDAKVRAQKKANTDAWLAAQRAEREQAKSAAAPSAPVAGTAAAVPGLIEVKND